MGKYRKKPVVIEAEQWFKKHDVVEVSDYDPAIHFARFDYNTEKPHTECGCLIKNHGWIDTLEGGHIVCPGDWIITGVEGEKYPCKPSIFEQTYEKC